MLAADSPWRRLAVIGNTGSGKSTFARRWRETTGAEHIELDALFWGPDWTPKPEGDFRHSVERAVRADRWVADGNYRRAQDLVWSRASAIIWLDYSLLTCFSRTLRRTLTRCCKGELLWGNNRESFRQGFLSTDSVLLWTLRTHAERRRQTEADIALAEHQHLEVVRFKTSGEAKLFLLSEIK